MHSQDGSNKQSEMNYCNKQQVALPPCKTIAVMMARCGTVGDSQVHIPSSPTPSPLAAHLCTHTHSPQARNAYLAGS